LFKQFILLLQNIDKPFPIIVIDVIGTKLPRFLAFEWSCRKWHQTNAWRVAMSSAEKCPIPVSYNAVRCH